MILTQEEMLKHKLAVKFEAKIENQMEDGIRRSQSECDDALWILMWTLKGVEELTVHIFEWRLENCLYIR